MCRPTTPKEVDRGVEARADVEVQADRAVVLVDVQAVVREDVREDVQVARQAAHPAAGTNTAAKESPAQEVNQTRGSHNEVDARSMEGAALR